MTPAGGFDSATFRETLRHLPTGVTLITGHGEDGPVGMACNSFTSVSLDPPLVLFCAAHSSTTWPLIQATGGFCVNVLGGVHEEISTHFGKRGVDRFALAEWSERSHGPGLVGASAWLDCEIDAEHEAGDHTIVVGRVLHLAADPADGPLVFYRGSYGTFARH